MILELIIVGLSALVVSVTTLTNILHMQLNEYLLYRYISFIFEKGLWRAIFPLRISFPAKTIRNLLIFGFVFFATCIYLYLILYYFNLSSVLIKSFLVIFSLILAKDFVVVGVIITTPFSWLYRMRHLINAKRELNRSDVKVIGVTGSYGKSSVKNYLHRILSSTYSAGKTRGNRNTEVGIAMEMALQITPSLKYFVAEMGAYRRGDIAKLRQQFIPRIGVVTGIGSSHISLFGSQENITKTKLEMVDGSMDKVYINGEWEGAREILENLKKFHGDKVVIYGFSDWVDIRSSIVQDSNSTTFTIKYDGLEEIYETSLLGKHNLLNLIPAIIISRKEGVEYEVIREVVSSLTPILGKLSTHTVDDSFKIINDSYNSNVDGFLTAIDILNEKSKKRNSKVYISTLGIFELGSYKADSYRRIVTAITDSEIELLTTDSLFSDFGSEYVKIFRNESDILEYLNTKSESSKLLLLEGRHSPFFTKALGITKAY